MTFLRRFRLRAGALFYDWPSLELRLRGHAREGALEPWLTTRNRSESIATDGAGVECLWPFLTELQIANVFPSTGRRLMPRALARWPRLMRDAPPGDASAIPRVSFLIGHRGLDRLPHLLATLRSIAGQSGAAFECIVVEQSAVPEIERYRALQAIDPNVRITRLHQRWQGRMDGPAAG